MPPQGMIGAFSGAEGADTGAVFPAGDAAALREGLRRD